MIKVPHPTTTVLEASKDPADQGKALELGPGTARIRPAPAAYCYAPD